MVRLIPQSGSVAITNHPAVEIGVGKSSVGSAMLIGHGLSWFTPDSFARELAAQFNMDSVADHSSTFFTYI
jgi:hypothetical protein